MKPYSFFLLILILNFTILTCDKSVSTGGLKPAPVVFVAKNADTSLKERGIDAVPDGDIVRLEWRENTEEIVDKYKVYRLEEEAVKYSLVSVTADTIFEDNDVITHKRYYYYVLAETDEGVTSDPSDTLNYLLLQKAVLLAPDSTVNTAQPTFKWRDPNDPSYDPYIIRVVNADSNKTIWISEISSTYSEQEETIFNADSEATVSQLTPEVNYIWRIDIVGNERSGSESNWKPIMFRGE
ncbi:MAG: hypothetical protein P8078_01620 [bacterium]